jgi:EF-hand domain pair
VPRSSWLLHAAPGYFFFRLAGCLRAAPSDSRCQLHRGAATVLCAVLLIALSRATADSLCGLTPLCCSVWGAAEEIKAIKRTFKSFDQDGNGYIEAHEIKSALSQCGEKASQSCHGRFQHPSLIAVTVTLLRAQRRTRTRHHLARTHSHKHSHTRHARLLTNATQPSPADLKAAMAEADLNGDKKISFPEYLALMVKLKSDPSAAALLKPKVNMSTTNVSGGHHSYSDEERMAFSEHINNCLQKDPHVGPRLPMAADTEQVGGASRACTLSPPCSCVRRLVCHGVEC